jgi:MFS family permease
MLKNTFLLAGMWGMGLGAAFVQLPATQNLLIDIGYTSISTFPLGIIMLGSAPCAWIIPKIINRYGEKKTFIAGSCSGILGALIQMIGALTAPIDDKVTIQVVLVVVGALPQAFTYASTNNLRFSVSQFSTPEFLPKATALVLLGGVLSALLGPLLSAVTRFMIPGALYAGNYVQIAVMYVVFATLAFFADFKQPIKDSEEDARMEGDDLSLVERQEGTAAGEGTRVDRNAVERTLREIIKETDLLLLTIFQCLSYNIMAMYMGQFKLPMAALGYSVDSFTYAITAHMLGMFLPGLFSGHIINRFGTWATTTVGFLLFPVGGAMFLINDSIAMFVVGITIVGIGWNFSFVGPSAEVSKIYSPAEQYKVVGFNDGIMLLTVGTFFLTASKIYIAVGSWNVFNFILIGFSVFSALLALLRGLCEWSSSLGDDNSFSADSLAQSLLTAGSLCTL